MELCNRIRSLRLERNYTQKYVGQKLGVSEVSVRCWENGTKAPSLKAIVSLSSLFGVSADYLLGISGSHETEALLLDRQESVLLSNYRGLDRHGRKVVDTVCMLEKSRVEAETPARTAVLTSPFVKEKAPSRYIPRYSTPSAAGY